VIQNNDSNDTIAAIATPPGQGGIAIIRVSGPRSFSIADAIFRCRGEVPSRRSGGTFVFGRIEANGERIDDALCLIMHGPRSFTGEDTVEFHGHGGFVQARRILQTALSAGARLAEPGEFSRRAFLNGKIDLAQAEAILDLIRARTDRAASAAVEQLEGSLSQKVNSIYDKLMAVAAELEASLDFPEDELPESVMPNIRHNLAQAFDELSALIDSWEEGHLLREGATLVIAGRPNAGKSTLLNALLGKDRAIVSHLPGTTRDVIEESLVLDGILTRIIDTAGLRNSECEIEREGIRRSQKQFERADLFLYVVDASLPTHPEDEQWLRRMHNERLIVILNKIDLIDAEAPSLTDAIPCVTTSLKTGDGLERLRAAIIEKLTLKTSGIGHHVAISERHRRLLVAAQEDLGHATKRLDSGEDDAIVPAISHLRAALEFMGRITGRVYEEELLDSIFSRFCIGK